MSILFNLFSLSLIFLFIILIKKSVSNVLIISVTLIEILVLFSSLTSDLAQVFFKIHIYSKVLVFSYLKIFSITQVLKVFLLFRSYLKTISLK